MKKLSGDKDASADEEDEEEEDKMEAADKGPTEGDMSLSIYTPGPRVHRTCIAQDGLIHP